MIKCKDAFKHPRKDYEFNDIYKYLGNQWKGSLRVHGLSCPCQLKQVEKIRSQLWFEKPMKAPPEVSYTTAHSSMTKFLNLLL